MRAVIMNGSGGPDVMSLGETERPAPGPNEVLIEVAATSINRADCAQRQGNYPPPPDASPILGLECAGVIAELGDDVDGWSIGDRVMTIVSGGGYAAFATAPAGTLLAIPDGMGMREAAAVTEVFMTAYLNIFIEADLKPDEAVLIQGGASGVGTAGIQLAKRLGSKAVLVTVGSADKAQACKSLGADHAILYKEQNFADAVNEITGKRGVDVILDHIGGKNLAANTACLALRGRLVIIGLMGGAKAELNLGRLMIKRQRVIGSVLRSRSVEEKTAIVQSFKQCVMPDLASGAVKPIIHDVIDLADARHGHRMMEGNENIGKIVMLVNRALCDD